MKTIKFGIIGGGLMGREFASAAARWCHLPKMEVRPEIVAVCDTNEGLFSWYTDNFASVKQTTGDYKELLANDDIEAVYCAVPHKIGQIVEVETGFLHSSDMNVDKAINWKRMIDVNGEYGVLGDLGMHACHVPFRAGWVPKNVRAILSNIVRERPDGKGQKVPCKTWDNGTLLCEMENPQTGEQFPWTFKSFRIAPGEKNTWYVKILGMKTSVRWSTKNPKLLEIMTYDGGEQTWGQVDMGVDTAFDSITGGIFETGFSDAVQQMWAGFLYELAQGKPLSKFAGCVTPEEAALSHRLFTAALESNRDGTTASL